MLTIWGRASSSNVQVVMWCIAEFGLKVERRDAGFSYGVVNTEDYLSMNPNGTIPTLVTEDGQPLFESAAIVRYLANCHAPEEMWPTDMRARATIDQWAEWAKINVAIRFSPPIFQKLVRTPAAKRDHKAIGEAIAALDQSLDIAETQLTKSRYLAGDTFTVADIVFGYSLFRYFDIDIIRPDRPALKKYYDDLTMRPAYADHVMVSYDELKVA